MVFAHLVVIPLDHDFRVWYGNVTCGFEYLIEPMRVRSPEQLAVARYTEYRVENCRRPYVIDVPAKFAGLGAILAAQPAGISQTS